MPSHRELEAGIERDFGCTLSYAEYLDLNMQFWRFHHLRTVQRIIGGKPGTGGSSGVPFLRRALDLTFFPELYEVRSRIQEVTPAGYHDHRPGDRP